MNPIDIGQYAGYQSVYRVKESDHKQRMFMILDNSLALPEYLVDFDYCMSTAAAQEAVRLTDTQTLDQECNQMFEGVVKAQKLLESNVGHSQSVKADFSVSLTAQDLERSDMGCMKRLLHEFMTFCHVRELLVNKFEFVDDDKQTSQLEGAMPPEILLRSQLSQMTL